MKELQDIPDAVHWRWLGRDQTWKSTGNRFEAEFAAINGHEVESLGVIGPIDDHIPMSVRKCLASVGRWCRKVSAPKGSPGLTIQVIRTEASAWAEECRAALNAPENDD